MNRVQLEGYVRHLGNEVGLQPSTVARHLAAIAGLFKFATADALIYSNPMLGVRRPRVPEQPQALGLEPAEMTLLLRGARAHSTRAEVLVNLLLLNGLRVSEVLGADLADLQEHRGLPTLRVRRKGSKVQLVPLAAPAAAAVRRYVADRHEGPLILSRTGRRLDRSSAGRLLRRVAETCLPPDRATEVHPHLLRHCFVAAALDAGVSLPEVQRAVGHASPTTTMRYDRERAQVALTHPTFRLADTLFERDNRRHA